MQLINAFSVLLILCTILFVNKLANKMNRESSVMKLDKNGIIKTDQNNKLRLNKPITILHIFILLALIIMSLILNYMKTTTAVTLIRIETAQIGIEYCLDACLCGIIFSFCSTTSPR